MFAQVSSLVFKCHNIVIAKCWFVLVLVCLYIYSASTHTMCLCCCYCNTCFKWQYTQCVCEGVNYRETSCKCGL